jgi:hypothetical protein
MLLIRDQFLVVNWDRKKIRPTCDDYRIPLNRHGFFINFLMKIPP